MRTASCVSLLVVLLLAHSAHAAASHRVTKKDTWQTLSAAHYGSAAYAPLLAEFAGSPKLKRPRPDALLQIPSLSDGMAVFQMDLRFEGLLRELAQAATSLAGLSAQLQPKQGRTKLSTPVVMHLRTAGSRIDNVRSALVATAERYALPERAVNELTSALEVLNDLAAGKKVDVQRIHKHLAAAMVDIIRWYRAGFR